MFFIAIEDGFYCASGAGRKTHHVRWATPFNTYLEAYNVATKEVLARKNATYFCILSSAPYQHTPTEEAETASSTEVFN